MPASLCFWQPSANGGGHCLGCEELLWPTFVRATCHQLQHSSALSCCSFYFLYFLSWSPVTLHLQFLHTEPVVGMCCCLFNYISVQLYPSVVSVRPRGCAELLPVFCCLYSAACCSPNRIITPDKSPVKDWQTTFSVPCSSAGKQLCAWAQQQAWPGVQHPVGHCRWHNAC